VEQSVAQAWAVDHAELPLRHYAVAVQAGEVRPDRRSQHVAADQLASESAGVLRADLAVGIRHASLQVGDLPHADALHGNAERTLLAREQLILRLVVLREIGVRRERSDANQCGAKTVGSRAGDLRAFQPQFQLDFDARRQRSGIFGLLDRAAVRMRLRQIAVQRIRIGLGRCNPRHRQFLSGKGHGRRAPIHRRRAVVDAVRSVEDLIAEMMPQRIRQLGITRRERLHRIGRARRQEG